MRRGVRPARLPPPDTHDTQGENLHHLIKGGHARRRAHHVARALRRPPRGARAPLAADAESIQRRGAHGRAQILVVVAETAQYDRERDGGVLIARLDGDGEALRFRETAREGEPQGDGETEDARDGDAEVKVGVPGPYGRARVGAEEETDEDEGHAGEVTQASETVAPTRSPRTDDETGDDAADDDGEAGEEAGPVDGDVVLLGRVRELEVDEKVDGEGGDGEEGGGGSHRHAQGEVAVEEGTPPVAVAAARGAHGDEEGDAVHGVVGVEEADAREAGEREEDELAHETDEDTHGAVEALLELREVNLGRLARREDGTTSVFSIDNLMGTQRTLRGAGKGNAVTSRGRETDAYQSEDEQK